MDILQKLEHNQVAQNILFILFERGFQNAPEELKKDTINFISKSVLDSGDEFVNIETFIHPLSKMIPHPNDPNDCLCNSWMAASYIFRGAVQGNKEGRETANNVLFDYNPLKGLPDWDKFVPLKSKVLQVINDLHEGLYKRVEKAFKESEE